MRPLNNAGKKQNAVCNPQPATRNPQRAAFTMELLTGEIKAELFGPGYLVFYRFRAKRFEKDYQLRKQRQGCNQGN